MDENNDRSKRASFCRKCGSYLIDDSVYCSKCGAKVASCEPVGSQNPIDSAPLEQFFSNTDPAYGMDDPLEILPQTDSVFFPKRKRKYVLFSCLGIVLLAVIGFGITPLISSKIKPQNIDNINGCPEFFDVEFGMTAERASKQIDLPPETVMKYENPLGNQDSFIFLSEDSDYNLYGLPVQDVYCGFDGTKLDCVIITFSKDKVGIEEVLSLYEKIYGQPDGINFWIGKRTMIEVIDDEETGDIDREIIVYYSISPNDQYSMLSFDGSEIDPCGFLSDNYIFDKRVDDYIDGLIEGNGYTQLELSTPGFAEFSQYTLYPKFEYMGISPGYTAIELNVKADDTYIDLVSYKFLLDTDNASDRIKYIEKRLFDTYGDYENCSYTSMSYSEPGIEEISFDEFCKRAGAGTQGLYNIQWVSTNLRITLNLTIEPEKMYYKGSVSFSF